MLSKAGVHDSNVNNILGRELNRFEPVYILRVEKHVAKSRSARVDLERMPSKADPLDYHAVWVDRLELPRGNKADSTVGCLAEDQGRRRWVVNGSKRSGDTHASRLEESFELVLVSDL